MLDRRRLRHAACVTVTVAMMQACTSGPPPPVDTRPHEEQIRAWRTQKDSEFRHGADSPIPAAERAAFTGLTYYPIDRAYQIPASLTANAVNPPIIIELPTSTRQVRRMRQVGTLGFSLEGSALTLTAFAEDGGSIDRLFVPFGDQTNGTETYGGGRYIELDRTPTGLYDLDFNRAYYPYCVYNAAYDCPVPPRENRLAVAIRAGERSHP
jgi:uncharacterized protein (DUF1684 family)